MIKADVNSLTMRHEMIMDNFIKEDMPDAASAGEEMILLETELRNRGFRPGWSDKIPPDTSDNQNDNSDSNSDNIKTHSETKLIAGNNNDLEKKEKRMILF